MGESEAVHPVTVRRAYDAPLAGDGARILVDRLWPRGVSRHNAHLTDWFKAVAPSTELRKWYAHVPDRFEEFSRRYAVELREPERAAALQALREIAAAGPLTLITATKDPAISEAAVLAELLRA